VKTSDDIHSSEQSAPEKRLEFERFLADLSGRLVALPPERVDDEIQNALKEVLEFFQIERCALLHLLPGKTLYRVEYNANANGISSPYVGITLPVSLFPWMTRKVAFEREVVSFARLEELPEEAATDKQTFENRGVRSGLYFSIAAMRSTDYSLGVTSASNDRTCPEEYIPRLRLLGELFVNAVERSRGELALRERMDEIERLKLQLEKENLYLREEIKTVQGFEKIIGKSEKLQYILFRVKEVAPTDATVLILGETGTGKGLVAHAIHELSARKERPIVTVNCAALPGNLIESELFGREKGAFTGAYAMQVGRFEVADTAGRSFWMNRRDARGPPGKAPEGAGGGGVREAGKPQDPQGEREGDRFDEPGPGSGGQKQAIPGGSLLPAERFPRFDPAFEDASRRYPPACFSLRGQVRPEIRQEI
jgi:transcriptional regulator with GAF, ATPase, and Fis domain